MTDLIEKLERAEGPSRELFEEVFALCFPKPPSYTKAAQIKDFGDEYLAELSKAVVVWAESKARFNRMLDAEAWESAALTLVPEGCLFVLKTLWDADKTAGYAIIQHYAPTSTGGKRYDGETTGLAATPAIALCIATLRAKEADNG